MDRLHTKAVDCEYDQRLTEQFIHGLDDKVMTGEIMRELTVLKDINEATSSQILIWAQRVEVQRAQKEVLDHSREDKEFDSIRWDKHKQTILGRME